MSSEEKDKKILAHIPKITTNEAPIDYRSFSIKNLFFDLVAVFCYLITHIFFREVEVVGLQNVPKKGPVILVCAPHSNQFVDAAIVFTPIKQFLGRNTSGIIAESSYKQRFMGMLAKLTDSIPVPRAQDNLKLVEAGKIYVNNSNIDGDCFTILNGLGTSFTKFEVSGIIGLPNSLGNYKIKEIINDEELILARPITNPKAISLLDNEEGVEFKYCDKVDTNKTFQNVFNHLYRQGLIAIWPEGGSHDRTDLLPLKPGVAIMALGSVAAITRDIDPDATITIIPTGQYYFHPNKFRSRAVLEFGQPIMVNKSHGDKYIEDPRGAVGDLLNTIKEALQTVTITAPDRETLRTIQAIRRLYKTNSSKPMSLATVNETNRRLLIGWKHYRYQEQIKTLFKSVQDYNHLIFQLGLKDHQIKERDINSNRVNTLKVIASRISKLVVFGTLSLPGVILFAPVFILVGIYSKKKQYQALKNSSVKVKAIDVVASWKVISATVTAPTFYVLYSIIGVHYIRSYNLLFGLHNYVLLFVSCYLLLVFTTYSAYRIGEAGMDIIKSLPPLFVQLISQNSMNKLRQYRENLSNKVTNVCNDLGPNLFDDFDKFYAVGKSDSVNDSKKVSINRASIKRIPSLSSLSNINFFSCDDHYETDATVETDDDDAHSLGSSFQNIEKSSVLLNTGSELHSTHIEKRG
ncbi:hypothetical protein DASC09_036060 [Saccharomycopsis crataegensis]|uniref:Phospholipid/glycerol acyltransferase domain-containing protein n=1 Tax=Saccharomycopsis crataegensis TaxID=43959 RepID=A0AAV5QNJ3_9ASCO|nr:hypothetical protein DASC09_036060 [Saccharomycopsis crataegensis]